MGRITTFVIGALAGALVGVCAGVILAPQSGAETRDLAVEKANSLVGGVKDAASSAKNKVVPSAQADDPSADELREKIEQARKRIAAEVEKKEAEQAAEATATA